MLQEQKSNDPPTVPFVFLIALVTCENDSLSAMTIVNAPAEIWCTIIKYTISVPVFFDVNPADSCGVEELNTYNHEAPYWESERCRSSLRRVCSSWNLYLLGFDHRYVRLTDVIHGLVKDWRMRQAVRLNLDPCHCIDCIPGELDSGSTSQDALLQVLHRLVEQSHENWSVEILRGQIANEGDLLLLTRQAPRLKSVVGRHSTQVAGASHLLPNLLTLCGTADDSALLTFEPEGTMSFLHLTTLQVHLTSLEPCSRWQLPTLRHLSFVYNSPEYSPAPEKFLNMLKAVGTNLVSLFYYGRPLDVPVPSELWQLCPRLERLQTPMLWETYPTPQHPLSCVRVDVEAVMTWGHQFSANNWNEAIQRYFPADALHRSGVLNAMLSCSWSDTLLGEYSSMAKDIAVSCKDLAARTGLHLTDVEGVTFEKYVVSHPSGF